MITLLTGQPGNGKTSKIINEIRKDLALGRTVYTVGIPKLTLPVIQLTRAQVMLWHERTLKPDQEGAYIKNIAFIQPSYFPRPSESFLNAAKMDADIEPVYELDNIVEGSKIYVDEAQKGFEPSGVKVPEHISYLSEHRHHGLDFVFISQFPFLVHQTIRALVTIHWHIRSTWKGRKIHEYPEWQERPQSQTALAMASSESYSIDPTTFNEYESASIHTKVTHKRPFIVYVVMASFILVPVLAYFSVTRIYAKTQPKPAVEISKKDLKNESTFKFGNNVATTSQPALAIAQVALPAFQDIQLVSPQYDWSKIAACVEFKKKCTCYGDEGNKLVVPESVCKAGVHNGWSGRNKPPSVAQFTEKTRSSEQVLPARSEEKYFTNSPGMKLKSSPNNR